MVDLCWGIILSENATIGEWNSSNKMSNNRVSAFRGSYYDLYTVFLF